MQSFGPFFKGCHKTRPLLPNTLSSPSMYSVMPEIHDLSTDKSNLNKNRNRQLGKLTSHLIYCMSVLQTTNSCASHLSHEVFYYTIYQLRFVIIIYQLISAIGFKHASVEHAATLINDCDANYLILQLNM